MAHRVTAAEVKEIIDTALTTTQVTPFIDTANAIVDAQLSTEYTEEVRKHIEKWLAAHLVAVRDRQVSREKIGATEAVYDGKADMNLDATIFGQQVALLDSKGVLRESANNQGTASLEALA